MMKIRKSVASTKRNNRELKSIESSSCHHTTNYRMKANSSNSSSLWRRILSIGLLLQILVNCGKFNYVHIYTIYWFSFSFVYMYNVLFCPLAYTKFCFIWPFGHTSRLLDLFLFVGKVFILEERVTTTTKNDFSCKFLEKEKTNKRINREIQHFFPLLMDVAICALAKSCHS